METNTSMKRHPRFMVRLVSAAVALTVVLSNLLGFAVPTLAAPSTVAQAPQKGVQPLATLPATTCTVVGTTDTCDIWAQSGTMTLPAGSTPATVPVWGFSSTSAGPVTLPGGPQLIVTQGDSVTINLHNVNLPSAVSLSLSQLPVIPDTTGVTAGSSKSYTFTASQPGTYLYEAGLTADGPRQVAMGLFGALIVRPLSTTCLSCAYDSGSTYNDEALLVLSEVDPAFNAAPLTFEMSDYHPSFWLINGLTYPAIDTPSALIGVLANDKLLVRYVNAGLKPHSMSLLGLHQSIIAYDGNKLANSLNLVAETIPTGETMDALIQIPAAAVAGAQYPLFDAAMHLDNGGMLSTPANPNPAYTPIAAGGMLTLITVAGTVAGNGGPVTSNVAVTPNPTNGSVAVTLTANITATTGTVTGAEYFIDTIGANGSGTALTGTFGAATVTGASATLSVAQLAGLSSGNHTLYVHGFDGTVWGAVASTVLNLDKTGPTISSMGLTPNLTNGTADVALQATASDVLNGNGNVTAAEYFIDPVGTPAGGTGTAITITLPTTVVSLSATIPAATVNGLSEGNHVIAVRALDNQGNWGAFGTINLTLDKTGPGTSAVVVTPNPTNGTFGVQAGSGGGFYERIDAAVADPVSGGVNTNIVSAEYFIDTVGANGTGGAMLAKDGVYNGTSENVFQGVDLYAIRALPQGPHTVYVHGLDAAGNWGPTATTTLVVDKTGPNITGLALTPNPSAGAASITLTGTATDPVNGAAAGSNVVAAEWFIGIDPGVGLGNPIAIPVPGNPVALSTAINVSTFLVGNYTISVRAQDAAQNWGPVSTVVLNFNQRPNAIFADGFESGNFSAWSATGGTAGRISVTTGAAAQAGMYGMTATIAGGTSGYVQDNTPTLEASYHARFYFNPNNYASTTNGTARTIFVGLNGVAANVFTVQVRRQAGGVYQVQAVVSRAGGPGTSSTNWFTIPGNAYTAIEIAWQQGNPASFSLYTGGVLRQTLTGLNTNAFSLQTVRLGPQGALGGMTGSVYFDSFVSTRFTVVGP